MLHFRSVVAILSVSVALGACACGTTKGTPDPTPAPLPDGVVEPTAEELDDARGKKGWGVIYLNGHATVVRWSDGDSFRFKSGEYDDNGVRLQRYNTLESFGPVHRWGTWTGQELYGIAKSSRFVASEKDWHCTTDGSRDGYGRVLVDCPDVAEHMVQQGHAHVFAIDTAADPDLLKLQATAQENGVGIWRAEHHHHVAALVRRGLREGEGHRLQPHRRYEDGLLDPHRAFGGLRHLPGDLRRS
jgi:endonuclease YncB( thermonuclease family)